MNGRTIGYWASTGLLSLAMLGSAAGYLTGAMNEAMGALGYPMYFVTLLGVWKGLGAIALLAPGLARLKEWAYAGFFFTFTGAAISHAAVGDGAGEIVAPLVMLAMLGASWALRPSDRVLGSLPGPSTSPTPATAS